MFIFLSNSFLVINNDDFDYKQNEQNKIPSILVFNIKDDSIVPIKVDLQQNNATNTKLSLKLLCGCFSETEKYMAICDDQKNIFLFNQQFALINTFRVKKNCVKIMFNKNEDIILYCDKSGDIYELNLNDLNSEAKLLLGHCSMLLDFTITDDQKYIIR